jgi:hypothetical protein
MQCFQEQEFPSEEFRFVEIRDDGIYSSTCSKGHTTLTVVQEQKFEMLFDSGAMALLDGYPREGITSFAAALERFYEFYVQVICLKHGVAIEKFIAAWKNVKSQSERQFGAYLFAYLIDHQGGDPPIIDNEKPVIATSSNGWKAFRNNAIHKGYIPSTAEAISYGNLIYCHIILLIKDLETRSSEFLNKAVFHHLARAHQVAQGNIVSTMSIPTIFRTARSENPPESLEMALESLEQYRARFHNK